jgi:WD40 repeat protein
MGAKRTPIWELVYYQNWKVEENWREGRYVLAVLEFGTDHVNILRVTPTTPNLSTRPFPAISPTSAERERRLISLLTTRLAFAQSTKQLAVWDLESGGLLMATSNTRGKEVTAMVLYAGRLLLGMADGRLELWDLKNRSGNQSQRVHDGEVSAISVLECGVVVTADCKGVIRINGSQVYANDGHAITALVAVHSKSFAASSLDGSIVVINSAGRLVDRFELHYGPINCLRTLALDQDDEEAVLLAGTDNGTLLQVTLLSRLVTSMEVKRHVPLTTLTSTANHIAVGLFDGSICVLDAASLQLLFVDDSQHRAPIWSLAADEANLFSSALDSSAVLKRNFLLPKAE